MFGALEPLFLQARYKCCTISESWDKMLLDSIKKWSKKSLHKLLRASQKEVKQGWPTISLPCWFFPLRVMVRVMLMLVLRVVVRMMVMARMVVRIGRGCWWWWWQGWKPHQPIPTHTNPYQTRSTHSNSYQPVPNCTNLYQPIPTYTNLYQPAPTCTNLYQPVPTCTNLYQPIPTNISPEGVIDYNNYLIIVSTP